MPTITIDMTELARTTGVEASDGVFDFWPYAPVVVDDQDRTYLINENALRVRTVNGLAEVDLPVTAAGNGVWVHGQNYQGGRQWLVQVGASAESLWKLVELDPDTLDPRAPASPAWLAGLAAVQGELVSKADVDALEVVAGQVVAKADQSDLEVVAAEVATKVDAADVSAKIQREGKQIFTGKTTLTPGRSAQVLAPEFVNHPHDLLTHAALGMPSIATMRVFCTDGIVTSPLGRYYAYIATDHDTAGTPEPFNGKGGVVLAYADEPTGPWTVHRDGSGNLIVWQDTVAGNQTETPTPLYVPDDPDGKPIYIYYQNQGVGLNQSTLLAKSATGRPEDFTRVGIVVQGRGTISPVWPGDGQSTYLEPQRINGRIIAVHLMGGGDFAQYGRSYSEDGRSFVTDPRRYGHFSHLVGGDNARRVSIRSLFQWRGKTWAVVTIGNHSSGFVTAPRQVGFVQLSTDLRRIVGRVHTLADAAIGAGQVLEHDGKLYMFYRTGDAYSAFRCAIAEG